MSIFQNAYLTNLFPQVLIPRIILENKAAGEAAIEMSLEFSTKEKDNTTSFLLQRQEFREALKFSIMVVKADSPQQTIQLRDQFAQTIRDGQTPQNFFSKDLNNPDEQFTNIQENDIFKIKKFFQNVSYDMTPPNIYIVYGCYLETPAQYESGYGLESVIFSNIKVQKIIENNLVNTTTDFYLLQDGTVWYGDVITDQDGNLTTDEQSPRSLTTETVPNYNLQDFRIRNQLRDLKIDFSAINNALVAAKSKSNVIQKPKKYFSDIYLSQQQHSYVSFVADYNQILQDNCLLYKNPDLSDEMKRSISEFSKIINLKMLRRRVKSSTVLEPFEKDLLEDILANGKDTNAGFSSQENLKEIQSGIRKFSNNRIFNFVDDSLNEFNEGVYQYGVEMEIVDGSINVIRRDISNLFKIKYTFEDLKIKTRAIAENNQKTPEEIRQEIIDFHRETISIVQQLVDQYLLIFNKYYRITGETQEFLTNIANNLKRQCYVLAISYNPKGADNFISLIENLISEIRLIIGEEVVRSDDPYTEDGYKEIATNTERRFTIRHYFSNDTVDVNYEKYKTIQSLDYKAANQGPFLNEFASSQFYDYHQLNIITFIPNKTLWNPYLVSYRQALRRTRQPAEYEYAKDNEEAQIQYNKQIRNNLINYTNVSIINKKIDVTQASTSLDGVQNFLESNFVQEINKSYEYFSRFFSKNKLIDEVLLEITSQEASAIQLSQLFEVLVQFSDGQEKWVDFKQAPAFLSPEEEITEKDFVVCRLRPAEYDYKGTTTKVSRDMILNDPFFLLSAKGLRQLNRQIYPLPIAPAQTETVATVTLQAAALPVQTTSQTTSQTTRPTTVGTTPILDQFLSR